MLKERNLILKYVFFDCAQGFQQPQQETILQAQLPFILAADQRDLLDPLWSATTASITLFVASWLASADKPKQFYLINPMKMIKYCIWQAQ